MDGVGDAREPRVTGCDQHVFERPFAVELEPAVDGADPLDPTLHEALLPAALVDDAVGMPDEVLDQRVVAVGRRLQHRLERPLTQRLAHREPRKRCRCHVAVGLRPHPLLPYRSGPLPPGGGRVLVRSEHRQLFGPDPSVPERRVARDCGEATSDDCTAHGAYLTEPASSPCTKYRWKAKKTASGTISEMNDAGAITSMLVPNSRS